MFGNGEFLAEEERQAKLAAERRAAFLALSPEEQKAKTEASAELQKRISLLNAQRPRLNLSPPTKLPLNTWDEKLRAAMAAGNWDAAAFLNPVSKFGWSADVPLGKYRFTLVNGVPHYIPWTREVLGNFIQKYAPPNKFGYSVLVEPGRPFNECDWEGILNRWIDAQQSAARQYPVTDWRHVYEIYPGRYICQVYRPSTWVKIRTPVAIAVGIVAAIYLGPIVYDKISGALVGGTKSATEAGTILQKVQSGVSIYNKAQTVNAIIHGEMPPPPIGISGANFTEWALDIAKKEMKDAIMAQGAEWITDEIADQMVKKEEAKMRAEIEALQRKMDALIPPGTAIEPSPELSPDIRNKISEIQAIEKQREKNTFGLLAVAIPAAFLLAS